MSKEVEEAIKNCNLFVQADATINLVDEVKGEIVFKACNTHDIEIILNYIKELEKEKRITELTKISCCTAQNCAALENAIREGLENNKLKKQLADSTPNEAIRDKIESLKAKCGGNVFHIQQTINAEISLLEEILEGEKE